MKHKKRPVRYKFWRKVTIFTFIVGALIILFVAGNTSEVTFIETIRSDLELREEVGVLQDTVDRLQNTVDGYNEKEIAVTSGIGSLLRTTQKQDKQSEKDREMIQKVLDQNKLLLGQNAEVMKQNKELLLRLKIARKYR